MRCRSPVKHGTGPPLRPADSRPRSARYRAGPGFAADAMILKLPQDRADEQEERRQFERFQKLPMSQAFDLGQMLVMGGRQDHADTFLCRQIGESQSIVLLERYIDDGDIVVAAFERLAHRSTAWQQREAESVGGQGAADHLTNAVVILDHQYLANSWHLVPPP